MYYFAYGSNLSKKQMEQRCPDSKVYQVALLKNFQLEFPRFSQKIKCGVASILPANGSDVWGVIYNISGPDLISINKYEGVAFKCYYPEIVQLELNNGSNVSALTYIAFRESDFVPPSDEYTKLIVEGAKDFKLPEEYIVKIQSIAKGGKK